MPRSKQSGRRRHKQKPKKGTQPKSEEEYKNYQTTKKSNAQYEQYYTEQGIIKPEEWAEFLDSMRQPLPTTFRITGFRGEAQEMLKIIKNEYINNLVSDGECPVHSLPWYPNELGWQIDLSRREIRHQHDLQALKDFLLNETESGNISRQEAVSMIPPLVLDVKPHHKVLDMCAAPGSKTAQLIELLHAEGDSIPEGYVIANDVDNKRCYLMVHLVKRLQSPCCAIVNHDATTLPNIRIGDGIKDFIQYDRVLCDVPCSGDGTLRKNPDIWHKWNPNIGPNLHKVQMKILKRGLELLAVGGRLVYSTCSLNPIENEAVIASILNQCKGCVELLDVSGQLPKLKYTKGLSTWKVFNKKMERFDNITEARDKGYLHLEASMFPPDDADSLHLDRCIRVLPHHQNTGGFFIVALQKTSTLPWMTPRPPVTINVEEDKSETTEESIEGKTNETNGDKQEVKGDQSEAENQEDKTATCSKRQAEEPAVEQPPTKHRKMHGYKEDAFLFLKPNDPLWDPIQKFYGIRSDFPVDQVMYRGETGNKRTIYFVSSQLRNILCKNTDRIRFINLGVKIFGRSASALVPDCDFRLSQEGLTVLGADYITRSVHLSKEDMITFITYDNPFFDKLSDKAIEDIKKFSIGCILMSYTPEEGDLKPSCGITVCGWRGKSSIRSFLSKNLRAHYLRLFGLELNEILKRLAASKAESSNKDQANTKNVETNGDDEAEKSKETDDVIQSEEAENTSASEKTNGDEDGEESKKTDDVIQLQEADNITASEKTNGDEEAEDSQDDVIQSQEAAITLASEMEADT